jgi:hypothetical protein
MTTQATLRSRRTKAESVYHVQVTGDRDAPTSPLVKIQVKIQGCSASLARGGSARMPLTQPYTCPCAGNPRIVPCVLSPRRLFARQHDMIFRWGCEPLLRDKGVQGVSDLLEHGGPCLLLHRSDLARDGGRGEKPQRIVLD